MKILFLAFILFVSVFLLDKSHSASELDQTRISVSETEIIIKQVSDVLNEHYVYPEVAKAMESFINMQMSTGKYKHVLTQRQLISELQSDLRKVSSDGHISLHLGKDSKDRHSHVLPMTESQKKIHVDFVSGDKSTKKIGYLRFDKFSGDADTKKRITDAMRTLAVSDFLIIDLRENGGGDPNLVAFLSSYFLEGNTQLWSLIDRNGDQALEVRSKGDRERFTGKLCLLTSNKTYSAAEAFAYTLKHLGRACVVGEATGGGAHLVEMQRVNDEVDIRVPVLRAYNPITKSNWEGKGVIPTISVEASKAKSVAISHLERNE